MFGCKSLLMALLSIKHKSKFPFDIRTYFEKCEPKPLGNFVIDDSSIAKEFVVFDSRTAGFLEIYGDPSGELNRFLFIEEYRASQLIGMRIADIYNFSGRRIVMLDGKHQGTAFIDAEMFQRAASYRVRSREMAEIVASSVLFGSAICTQATMFVLWISENQSYVLYSKRIITITRLISQLVQKKEFPRIIGSNAYGVCEEEIIPAIHKYVEKKGLKWISKTDTCGVFIANDRANVALVEISGGKYDPPVKTYPKQFRPKIGETVGKKHYLKTAPNRAEKRAEQRYKKKGIKTDSSPVSYTEPSGRITMTAINSNMMVKTIEPRGTGLPPIQPKARPYKWPLFDSAETKRSEFRGIDVD